MNEGKRTNRKRWIWIGIGIVALLVAAVLAAPLLFGEQLLARQQNQAVSTGQTVTAFVGDLTANAAASGQIKAQRDARLALTASGEVAEVHVAAGDQVTAGQPLLTLDTAVIERAVQSAEQTLLIQQANLAALLAAPTASALAASEAAVASAQAQLDGLRAGPSEAEIAASEANVRAAQANVWAANEQLQLAQSGASQSEIASAQAELIGALGNRSATQELYDKLTECFDINTPDGQSFSICPGLGDPEEQTRSSLAVANANATTAQARLDALLGGPDANSVAIAQASLAAASAQLEASRANHQLLLRGVSQAQIVAAEASLAQAQANLDALVSGPSAAQAAAAEVAVEQARIGLQRAQRNLANATLAAPFAGVVTAVYVNPGETASGILVEMVDTASLEVSLSVDEVDVGDIAIGQPAEITLETWPDTVLSGEVVSIAPRAMQNNSAVVSYEVFLSLGETDLPVRVGMTANANLRTNNYENVLLVGNAAINADRSRGTYSVNRVTTNSDGSQTVDVVPVTIGLRDGAFTQITSGLAEGDVLLIGNVAPVFQFGSGPPPGAGDGGGPFGGG
ncbi:MAG: HlyD family efflux transporter periplasmic adaptor subunit [Chloroflexi bacterium]|nr:HlyD family efflux transporter periplasmic adaptor subunit [Chloroflexota bacterium]